MTTGVPAEPDDVEDAILAIFMDTDLALREGRFADVDSKLREINPAALAPVLALAWLSITKAAEEHLSARKDFVAAYLAAFGHLDLHSGLT